MKTLILVRHAKSSWDDLSLNDFERPLNERGKRDAPRMAQLLKQHGIVPHSIVSSPARRAKKTAQIFADNLFGDDSMIGYVSEIYEASLTDLMAITKKTDEKIECCMLVGHNPGMTDFANALLQDRKQYIENIPTSGIVVLKLDLDSWKSLTTGSASLLHFLYPALLP